MNHTLKTTYKNILILSLCLITPLVLLVLLRTEQIIVLTVFGVIAITYILISLLRHSRKLSLGLESLSVQAEVEPKKFIKPNYTIESYKHKINGLNKIIGSYDEYTMNHNKEVAQLTLLLSEKLEITAEVRNIIYYAGLIHDIGKIQIEDQIINKPNSLTADEFSLVKGHSERGYEMVKRVEGLEQLAKPILHHHEKWNGYGYPEKLVGHEIPIESQVIAICDTVSAMKNNRVYSKSKTKQQIIVELIYQKDKQFNAYIVDKMLEVLQMKEYELL